MIRIMVLGLMLVIGQFTAVVYGQESTAEEFQEFGNLLVGRWSAEVVLIADWPGLKKKAGEKQIVYTTRKWEADQKAVLEFRVGGETTSIHLWGYDPVAKRIFGRSIGSAGGTYEVTITKETPMKWNWELVAGGLPTGEKVGGKGYHLYTDEGRTLLIDGDVTLDGKPTPKRLHDTHIRIDE